MKSDEEISKKIEESKKASIKDSVYVNGTVGFGDNYISAYAVELNATAHHIGLLTSIPNLVAPLAQLFTSRFMKKHSRKKIFSILTLIQSLIWIPIILTSMIFLKQEKYAIEFLILFYTIYAFLGNFASPAWVSWIGDIVGKKDAGKFFGIRNKLGGISALISLIVAGVLLDIFRKQSQGTHLIFWGFSIIFLIAMICRLISRYFVLKQYEPKFEFKNDSYFSFKDFIKNIPKSNYGKFSLYIAMIVLATNIAGPYYALYMLRDLSFSYMQYMMISVAGSIASFIFVVKWGRFADEFGNIKLLRITSIMIPLICFLWPLYILIPSPFNFYFILLANFISGFAWAGFNMAAGNFVFDVATPEKRGLCSAYSSIMNGIGVVIGTTIGAFLISHNPFALLNSIMFVSIISGIVRYVVSLMMVKKIKEVRETNQNYHWKKIPLAFEVFNMNIYLKNGIKFLTKNKSTSH